MARRHVVHSGSVQIERILMGLSCTLLTVFACSGRFQGGACRKKTVEVDNDVHRSSVQDGGERKNRRCLRPRKKQVAKIENALHQLGKELMKYVFLNQSPRKMRKSPKKIRR